MYPREISIKFAVNSEYFNPLDLVSFMFDRSDRIKNFFKLHRDRCLQGNTIVIINLKKRNRDRSHVSSFIRLYIHGSWNIKLAAKNQ